MEQILSFDQLPKAVTMLTKEVSELKQLLLNKYEEHPTEVPEKFLTVKEAAQFLRLTVPTIYSKVSKRELPVMKRGKRLYFSQIELMGYLKEGHKKAYDQVEGEAAKYLNKK